VSRCDRCGVWCGVVGGARVCHPDGHGRREASAPEDCGSHSPNHDVEGGNYYGGARGRGRGVNKGPTSCTEKSYWGVTKKVCYADQYRGPPMYGSWKAK
jgi:hypothetical protein